MLFGKDEVATPSLSLQDLFEDPTAIVNDYMGEIGEGQTNGFNFLIPPCHLGTA